VFDVAIGYRNDGSINRIDVVFVEIRDFGRRHAVVVIFEEIVGKIVVFYAFDMGH
jgi:hypothetical protein